MKLFKSQAEKDMERRMQVKKGRRTVERHIRTQEKQVQRYWELAKQAYRLGNADILKKLVSLISKTRLSIDEWKKRLLYFDMIEAMRDQALAGAEFAKAFQSMSETILDNADPAMLNNIQMELEKSMMVAEELEDRLEDFQSSMDDMLADVGPEQDKAELTEIMRMIQSEAEQEPEATADPEIAALEKQIEAMLGRKV
jgi:hypothetical protein